MFEIKRKQFFTSDLCYNITKYILKDIITPRLSNKVRAVHVTTPKLGFSGGFLPPLKAVKPPLKPLTAVLTAVSLPPFMRVSEKVKPS